MQALKRLLVLFVFLAAPAWAVPQAAVEAVQMPAWIEHNGRTRPLAVGMMIAHGDRIRTGQGARVYLELAEGSTVKLGEHATVALFGHSLQPRMAFKGALDVLSGAFRFTTGAIRRTQSREVAIRVGTATAGIRGTDIWGRSDAQEDLVCLIEGKVEIKHTALAEPVTMSEPMSFFVAPHGEAPKPVAAVDPIELRKWARQTEIEAGEGAVRKGGKLKLLLGRHAAQSAALAQYDAARNAGFAARIEPLAAQGGWNYDVMLAGFRAVADAASAAARLRAATGIEAAIR